MNDNLQLNVALLKRRVPNLTAAAQAIGLRPATVSNLCTGKVPVGRAEVRTLTALADLARVSLDELVIRNTVGTLTETGIKVVDLLAPVVRGGTLGVVAHRGVGQLVLVAEILYRLRERGFVTVLWNKENPMNSVADVACQAQHVITTLDTLCNVAEDNESGANLVIAADRSMVLSGALLSMREQIRTRGLRQPTVILADTSFQAPDEESPYGPLDTLWRFDTELASRGVLPALNPIASTSILLEGEQGEAEHVALQQRVRRVLRRFRELRPLVLAWGVDRLPTVESASFRQGALLEAFLTQWFYVAEAHSGHPGVSVTLHETLDGVRRILDGRLNPETTPENLKYQGTLP